MKKNSHVFAILKKEHKSTLWLQTHENFFHFSSIKKKNWETKKIFFFLILQNISTLLGPIFYFSFSTYHGDTGGLISAVWLNVKTLSVFGKMVAPRAWYASWLLNSLKYSSIFTALKGTLEVWQARQKQHILSPLSHFLTTPSKLSPRATSSAYLICKNRRTKENSKKLKQNNGSCWEASSPLKVALTWKTRGTWQIIGEIVK